MNTFLVTGSSGFIGSHVCQALLLQGHRVVGLDDHNDSTSVPLKERRKALLDKSENFSFFLGSTHDPIFLEQIFQQYSFLGVLNFAARAGVRKSIEDPAIYLSTNVSGLINILELCHRYGVKRLVHASTSSLYEGEQMPFLESMAANCPISPYAASKKAAEAYAYVYQYLYGISTTVLRFFTVYGSYGRPDMSILRFCKRIYEQLPLGVYGDGSQTRDFTHIDDVTRAVLLCLSRYENFEIYNVGNDHAYSLRDMVEILEKRLGKKAIWDFLPADPLDMKHTRANIDKLRSIGWEPQISFADGLNQAADWFMQEYEWLRHIEI